MRQNLIIFATGGWSILYRQAKKELLKREDSFLIFNTLCDRATSFLNKPKPDGYEWLFIISLSVALTIVLHENSLNGYWRFDDGSHLLFATRYSPWEYFFDPAITLKQSGANVTPWNVFFYDLNLSIFGFEPRGFYFHLLLLMVGSTAALYALLRLWLSLPSAVLGIFMFLTGKPTYHLSQQLMTGHYLTGLLFSLLSLIFFTHYLRHGNSLRLLASVVLYALAMTCKEIYVPLIALLFVLPAGNIKQRIAAIIPFSVVSIGYALWRYKVLGKWLGGYGSYSFTSFEINTQAVIQQYSNIPTLLFDDQSWGLAALVIIIIMSLLAAWNRILNIFLVTTTVIILLAPLLPLTRLPGIHGADRYLFAVWVAVSIWIAIICQSSRNTTHSKLFRQAKIIVKSLSVLVLVIASFLGHLNEKQKQKEGIHQIEERYRLALAENFPKQVLIFDRGYWAQQTLQARRAYNISKNLDSQPILITVNSLIGLLFLDEITQDTQLDLSATIFSRYYSGQFYTFNINTLVSSKLDLLKAGKDQLVQVTLGHKNNIITWNFKPKGINYSVIVWDASPSKLKYYNLTGSQGSYSFSLNDETEISVIFENPGKWAAVSPRIKLAAEQGNQLWQGKTDLDLVTKKLESLLFRFGQ